MPSMHHTHPEADERTEVKQPPVSAKSGKAFKVPTSTEAADIDVIVRWQTENGVSDKALFEFVKGDFTTWLRVRQGSYVGSIANVIARAQQAVKAYQKAKTTAAAMHAELFYKSRNFTNLESLVATAKGRVDLGDNRRGVIAICPPGFGKTSVLRQLIKAEPESTRRLHAMPSWRSSYKAILVALAEVCHCGESEYLLKKTNTALELMLHARLSEKRMTLVIEELSLLTMSPLFVELLKGLLNETKVVLVLFAVDEFASKLLNSMGQTAEQLIERCVLERFDSVDESVVASIFKEHFGDFDGLATVVQVVCTHANAKAGYRLARTVAENLEARKVPVTAATADAECQQVRTAWALQAARKQSAVVKQPQTRAHAA